MKKLYSNANKNILDANFLELYNSYESKENLFTLFSDGIILYKNLQDSYFNIFPQNKFKRNEDLGVFDNISDSVPYSYYGFSAFINNTNQIGILCHLTKQEVRNNTFRNFNLQISPLSMNDMSLDKCSLLLKFIPNVYFIGLKILLSSSKFLGELA